MEKIKIFSVKLNFLNHVNKKKFNFFFEFKKKKTKHKKLISISCSFVPKLKHFLTLYFRESDKKTFQLTNNKTSRCHIRNPKAQTDNDVSTTNSPNRAIWLRCVQGVTLKEKVIIYLDGVVG